MNHNKNIFETIIDVLRRANIGFSINEVKDMTSAIKPEKEVPNQEKTATDNPCPTNGK